MRRCALALAGLLALPVLAHAQNTGPVSNEPRPELLPQSRWAVTPYIGVRVPYTTGEYTVFTEGGDQLVVQEERGGSFALGIAGELRLRGPFSAIGSVTFSPGQEDIYQVRAFGDSVGDAFRLDGADVTFVKAGIAARLPDPFRDDRRYHPSAFVYAAPALVWMRRGEIEGADPAFGDDSFSFALNLGADAVQRIGRGNWALSLGFEDFITFWDTDGSRDRDELIFASYAEEPVVIEYDYGTSHLLLLRLGVSYRH